eukprot:13485705-Alexandrium_andersonii.AAC.1
MVPSTRVAVHIYGLSGSGSACVCCCYGSRSACAPGGLACAEFHLALMICGSARMKASATSPSVNNNSGWPAAANKSAASQQSRNRR